jgi:amidophosphoribosyltransferase
MMTDDALIAVRDPNGFRPLALGRLERPDGGTAYCVASETCAFDIIGAEFVRDVAPGEILVIDREGLDRVETSRNSTNGRKDMALAGEGFNGVCLPRHHGVSQCVFEYVYFSRPDSKIFGAMVDKVRRKIGKALAYDAPPPHRVEGEKRPIVISVPDSSNTATLGYVTECQKLGYDVRYEIGLIRNHYVGRTFISPGQDAREMKVRTKFNPVEGLLKDRVVVMVDDSIVRGTTAKQLVKMVRLAGAKEVHFRSAAPPVISPCFYGMDFPTESELLANQYDRNVEKMAAWLGVDSLAYVSVDGMMEAVRESSGSDGFCNACFTTNYPVPVERGVEKEENEW